MGARQCRRPRLSTTALTLKTCGAGYQGLLGDTKSPTGVPNVTSFATRASRSMKKLISNSAAAMREIFIDRDPDHLPES